MWQVGVTGHILLEPELYLGNEHRLIGEEKGAFYKGLYKIQRQGIYLGKKDYPNHHSAPAFAATSCSWCLIQEDL